MPKASCSRASTDKEELTLIHLIDHTGRTILVTVASSGIGKQIAITLSGLGAKLVLVARREEKLQETLQMLEGLGHTYYCADLSAVSAIESLIKQIVTECGPLDGLVYAAGISAERPVAQFNPERVQAVFDINFFGFLETVRQVCRNGRFNKGMRIVGISSTASIKGNKAQTVYAASKGAMNAAVRCIDKEVADIGICINTVAPAMTATEMYERFIEKHGEESRNVQELFQRQYLGVAKTEDVANAVAFLISPAARFITGITLPVDGGLTTC